jgi:hypothetical protein
MGSGRSKLYSGTHGSNAIPGSTYYMDPSDNFSKFIKKRKDIDANGFYDIIAHGTTKTIQIQHNGKPIEITHRVAAKLFSKNPNFNGKSIRLLSCDTGGISRGFAQGLADRLGIIVEAPTKLVWVKPDGNYFVAGRSKTNPNVPDMSNRGRFIKFYPKGAKK